MKIDFNSDNVDSLRCSEILTQLFHSQCTPTTMRSLRAESLASFGVWLEEYAPCKIKMRSDGIGIDSIEIEEKDYLLLVLKHYKREDK